MLFQPQETLSHRESAHLRYNIEASPCLPKDPLDCHHYRPLKSHPRTKTANLQKSCQAIFRSPIPVHSLSAPNHGVEKNGYWSWRPPRTATRQVRFEVTAQGKLSISVPGKLGGQSHLVVISRARGPRHKAGSSPHEGAASRRRREPVKKFRTRSTAHFSAVQAKPAAEVEF
jgi:hypothetical protein